MRGHTLLPACFLCLACAAPEAWTADEAASALRAASAEATCAATDAIGFAHLVYDTATVIPFHAAPSAHGEPVTTVQFHAVPNDVSFRVLGQPQPALRPDLHRLEYPLFELEVAERREGWLRVDVGEGRLLWTREGSTVRYDDWPAHLRGAFSIEPLDRAANPLRAAAHDGAPVVLGRAAAESAPEAAWRVDAVAGDWMRVRQDDVFKAMTGPPAHGWMRWRDAAGCLAVTIYRTA